MKSADVQPETKCGYCTQSKRDECRVYDYACATNDHPLILLYFFRDEE
jgi:hypothetical protein